MESLTKESFWNELTAKYPDEMKVFCDWIDEYKTRVSWDELFYCIRDQDIHYTKYHDLPIAMQIGIFMQFVMEGNHQYYFEISTSLSWEQIKQEIRDWFCAEDIARKEDKETFTRIHDTDSD